MKYWLVVLLFSNCVYAQTAPKTHLRRFLPSGFAQRDSLPDVFPPDIVSAERMPNARPHIFLYRNHSDPPNVLRSTLDNMPIKVPDSSVHYSILRSYQKYLKPDEPPLHFRRPVPWGRYRE